MINLLPPQVKEQLAFAKLNAVVMRYLKVVTALIIVLAVAFGGTYVYLSQRISGIDTELANKQAVVDSYKPTQKAAKVLNDRVAAIKSIQNAQPRFSKLLDDIAKFTLKGTSITSLALTGEDNKPLVISATAQSYSEAVSLRDALATSGRISGADIQSIADQGDGTFKVDIVIGFKPGQAR